MSRSRGANQMTFEELITSEDRGIIVVCNLLDTEASGLIGRNLIIKFTNLWRAVYEVLRQREAADLFEELLASVTEIVDPEALWNSFRIESTHDFRFLKGLVLPEQPLSTVKTTKFIEDVLDQESREWFEKEGIAFPYSDRVPNGEYQALKLLELAAHETRFLTGTAGLGEYPLWATMTGHLERGIAGIEVDKLGDRVRDLVGLVHRTAGDVVLRVDLPHECLREGRFARPTIFDGPGPRFTSVPRDPPEDEAIGWGWTFQLEALHDATVRAAGVPECVCDSHPASGFAGREFAYKPLGIVQLARSDPLGENDDKFAAYLMNGRTRDELRAALCALR